MDIVKSRTTLHLSALGFAIALSSMGFPPANAQVIPSLTEQQEQRERAEREARERAQRQAVPDVSVPTPATASDFKSIELPVEEPCFVIDALVLEGERTHDFAFAQRYLDRYAGRCIGQEGIGLIARRVSDRVLAKGYVTTRIGLPEQNLSSGTLRLQGVPGMIRAIRFADEARPDAMWKVAFPVRPGDLLNLRELEQGLEQLKRVPSQDATMDIVPGEQAGESDVVITLTAQTRWRGTLALDDSGSRSTGKQQASATVWADNLARINDLLTLGVNSDGSADNGRGTHGYNAAWTFPVGNWRVGVNGYGSRYEQSVLGTTAFFQTSGRSSSAELTLERLLSRSQHYRTGMELRIGQRRSHSYVENVEIANQRRRTTSAELALVHRQYLGKAQADLRLAHRRGIPWLGGDNDAAGRHKETPTFRYGITTVDIAMSAPLSSGEKPVLWNSALRYQWSGDSLYATDFITIGGRYTVNGYDGELTLGGATGGYWRNSLTFLAHRQFAPYAGFDIGHIAASQAQGIAGGNLTGVHVGFRGDAGGALSWDAFVGFPLHAPEPIKRVVPARVTGFRLAWQF